VVIRFEKVIEIELIVLDSSDHQLALWQILEQREKNVQELHLMLAFGYLDLCHFAIILGQQFELLKHFFNCLEVTLLGDVNVV
jgi:hypothetical protein